MDIPDIKYAQEYAARAKKNPLMAHQYLPQQQLWANDPAKIKVIFGGNRCLGAETEIYDPVLKQSIAVGKIKENFHVLAWDGKRLVISEASKPFTKDAGSMFKVTLCSGESFVCSGTHQVLGLYGYQPVSLLHEGFLIFLPKSKPESYQTTHVSDVQNYSKTNVDFRSGCPVCFHSCDAPPLSEKEIFLNDTPSPSDAQAHSTREAFLHKDVQDNTPKHSHRRRSICHPSNQDGQSRIEAQFVGILFHASYKLYKLALRQIQVAYQSMLEFFLQPQSIPESDLQDIRSCCAMPRDNSFRNTAYSAIISIEYIREDVKWDFTVPKYHNYYACGAIHHNSGKTEAVSCYVDKKMISMPAARFWCCALTFAESVNIQQAKMARLMPLHKIKYGSYDEINGYTNRKLLLKNRSLAIFKSYDQKREAFQGDAIDLAWCDEEPDLDIWQEIKMRLLDRDGELLLSMTSLRGVTELIEEIFEGHTVIKSRYAALVDEVLPVIAEKNGVKFYFLWTENNPYINYERMMEEAKLMTRQEIKSRFYGIPINLQGKIYPSFNKDVHVIGREDVELSGCQIYNVLDPHDRKPWAIGWYAVHPTGSVCAIEEYPERNFNDMLYDDKTYDEYAKYIKMKESILMQGVKNKFIKRIIDPNFGNKTMQLAQRQGGQAKTTPVEELKKRGLIYKDGIDSVEAGHLQVRQFLHWEEKDAELIVQPKFFICDNCTNHIRHMSRYSRKDITSADGDVKDKVKPKEAFKDFCFVAGTMVRTSCGQIPIEDIKVGDLVETDIGLRKVLVSMATGFNRPTVAVTFSNGKELCGTPNHQIYLQNGLKVSLDLLRYGDTICVWQEKGHTIGKLEEVDICNLDQDFFTEKFGKKLMGKFRKGCTCIISTVINLIMTFLILNFLRLRNIGRNIHTQKNVEESLVNESKSIQDIVRKWQHGIKARMGEKLHLGNLKRFGRIVHLVLKYVKCVGMNFKLKCVGILNFVPIIANQDTVGNPALTMNSESVLSVIPRFLSTNTLQQKPVPENAVAVVKVLPNSKETVYNITVEGRHRYYANDILVANCDLVRYLCMSNPRFIVKQEFESGKKRSY